MKQKKMHNQNTKQNKFSVITPCFQAENYIRETIESVLLNSAVRNKSIELEYIVCDGGSSDNTISIIEKTFSSFNQKNIKTILMSEKDLGMYHALSKSLQMISGNIISYLNAGDFYSPHCFEIVAELFHVDQIKWLTGLDVVYNQRSHMIYSALPFCYRKNLIQCGFYNLKTLPHIQQESTFWDSSLNALIDHEKLKRFKYAGDYYLWKTFSSQEDLYIVEAWLGGFKVHKGQLSSDEDGYNKEMKSITKKPRLIDFFQMSFDKMIWSRPNIYKKWFNRKTLFSFNHLTQKYESP